MSHSEEHNLRARSAFKLLQIEKHLNIFDGKLSFALVAQVYQLQLLLELIDSFVISIQE